MRDGADHTRYLLRLIALGNSGTGQTRVALALGLAVYQKCFAVVFTAVAPVSTTTYEIGRGCP